MWLTSQIGKEIEKNTCYSRNFINFTHFYNYPNKTLMGKGRYLFSTINNVYSIPTTFLFLLLS